MEQEKPQIKAVAIVKRSGQISPDDWDTWIDALEINETTTIGEIVKWMRENHPGVQPYFSVTPLQKP